MNPRITLSLLLSLSFLTQASDLAQGQTGTLLYDNGAPNFGQTWDITSGNFISNSWVCPAAACDLSLSQYILERIDKPNPVELNYRIDSTPFGTGPGNVEYAAATGMFACDYINDNGGGVCGNDLRLIDHIVIPHGEAWLTLSSETPGVTIPDSVDPMNTAFYVSDGGVPQMIPGSAFAIYGTPIPEPSSILMFGSGMLGLAGMLRRKLNLR